MSSAAWGHQIDLLVRARTPLIWVRSNEEARVESLLGEASLRLARQLVCWNFIDGISGAVQCRWHQLSGYGVARQVEQWG